MEDEVEDDADNETEAEDEVGDDECTESQAEVEEEAEAPSSIWAMRTQRRLLLGFCL